MASGTFYDSWGPTNTATDSSNRYHQNHLKVTWSSDNEKVTYTINAYARSGNGSGYYYMSDYGVTVTLYCLYPGTSSWTNIGSASGTLNYGNAVANITKTVTINRTHSSQGIKFKAVNTGGWLYTATTETGWDTINAKPSYTVSYNANGGTGAPGNQTKWYGETLTLTSSIPSRASSTQDGYVVTFNSNGAGYANTSVTAKNTITYGLKTGTNRWNTNSAGTGTGYASGGSYTSNAALTLYAQWTQTSSPGSVNIPNEMKKRDGYTFQGWGTTTAETSIVATAGATTYQPDGNKTLYAIWKQNYVPVALTNIKAIRVATTTSTTTADAGPVGYITVNWTKGDLNGTKFNASKIIYSYNKTGETPSTGTITPSESATTTSFWINNLSIDDSWNIAVTAIDSHDNSQSSKVTLLSPAFFTMDFLKGGRGIAFGKPATITSVFDIGLNTQINNSITSAPALTISAVTINNVTPTAVSINGATTITGATTISGATIIKSGTLTVSANNIICKSTNVTSNATTSNLTGSSGIDFRDSANATIGFVQSRFESDGDQFVRLGSTRVYDNSSLYNILYLGLKSDGSPTVAFHNQACKTAWLDALGLTVENRTLTPNTSNVTMQGENYARSFGNVVSLNLVFTTNKQIPAWDNQNFVVGTMDKPCAYYKQYMVSMCQINNNWTLMQAGINSNGEVRIRTLGTAIPSGTWMWVFGTYISA